MSFACWIAKAYREGARSWKEELEREHLLQGAAVRTETFGTPIEIRLPNVSTLHRARERSFERSIITFFFSSEFKSGVVNIKNRAKNGGREFPTHYTGCSLSAYWFESLSPGGHCYISLKVLMVAIVSLIARHLLLVFSVFAFSKSPGSEIVNQCPVCGRQRDCYRTWEICGLRRSALKPTSE